MDRMAVLLLTQTFMNDPLPAFIVVPLIQLKGIQESLFTYRILHQGQLIPSKNYEERTLFIFQIIFIEVSFVGTYTQLCDHLKWVRAKQCMCDGYVALNLPLESLLESLLVLTEVWDVPWVGLYLITTITPGEAIYSKS